MLMGDANGKKSQRALDFNSSAEGENPTHKVEIRRHDLSSL
jgi:hypothetical protein